MEKTGESMPGAKGGPNDDNRVAVVKLGLAKFAEGARCFGY